MVFAVILPSTEATRDCEKERVGSIRTVAVGLSPRRYKYKQLWNILPNPTYSAVRTVGLTAASIKLCELATGHF